jgi:hypothetical protein
VRRGAPSTAERHRAAARSLGWLWSCSHCPIAEPSLVAEPQAPAHRRGSPYRRRSSWLWLSRMSQCWLCRSSPVRCPVVRCPVVRCAGCPLCGCPCPCVSRPRPPCPHAGVCGARRCGAAPRFGTGRSRCGRAPVSASGWSSARVWRDWSGGGCAGLSEAPARSGRRLGMRSGGGCGHVRPLADRLGAEGRPSVGCRITVGGRCARRSPTCWMAAQVVRSRIAGMRPTMTWAGPRRCPPCVVVVMAWTRTSALGRAGWVRLEQGARPHRGPGDAASATSAGPAAL